MTSPKSPSERLRYNALAGIPDFTNSKLLEEAANALDAKDELIKRQSAEIGRLVAVTLHCGARDAVVERQAALLVQAAVALGQMIEDTEHLTNILESKAEQEWNYEYERPRIASAREALAAIREAQS